MKLLGKLEPRQKRLITFILIAVVAGTCYLIAYRPLSLAISNSRAEYEQKVAELQLARRTYQEFPAVLERYERAAADWQHFESTIPIDMDMPLVLAQIDALAGESGVVLRSAQPGASTVIAGFSMVGLTMRVEGGYANLIRFLEHFDTLPFPISVKSVSLTSGGNGLAIDAGIEAVILVSSKGGGVAK